MAKKRRGKVAEAAKPEERDHDLETWAKLGGGVIDDDLDDGLTEGERIMEAGNQWARQQLQPARLMTPSVFAVNPFRRDQ
jgi:hypothetical protein